MEYAKYFSAWKAIGERQDWALQENLRRNGVWQRPFLLEDVPGAWAEEAFSAYLRYRMWTVGDESDLARFCIDFAEQQTKTAMEQNAFDKGRASEIFPRNRADFLSSKIFIDGFKYGKPLNREEVIRIAADRVSFAQTYGVREWDAAPQSDYQSAIDLLLLVDEYDYAKELVDNARSMKGLHVKELFAVAKLILNGRGGIKEDKAAVEKYRRVFDTLRNPGYGDGLRGHPARDVQILIMACMWQKFFEPGVGIYNYDTAIRLLVE